MIKNNFLSVNFEFISTNTCACEINSQLGIFDERNETICGNSISFCPQLLRNNVSIVKNFMLRNAMCLTCIRFRCAWRMGLASDK